MDSMKIVVRSEQVLPPTDETGGGPIGREELRALAREICADHNGPSYWNMLTDAGREYWCERVGRAIERAGLGALSFHSCEADVDADARAFLSGVVGVAEATREERFHLWEWFHEKLGWSWKSESSGIGRTVGHVGDMPVFIALSIAEVSGCKILFVEATSQVVDHRMVEAWLKRALPEAAFRPDGYINQEDAANFVNVVRAAEVAQQARTTTASPLSAEGAQQIDEVNRKPTEPNPHPSPPSEDRP